MISLSYRTIRKFSHVVITDISVNKFYISHFRKAAEVKRLTWPTATELVYDLDYLYHLLGISGRERELVLFNWDKTKEPHLLYLHMHFPLSLRILEYKSYLVQIPFITQNGQLKCVKPGSNNFSYHYREGCGKYLPIAIYSGGIT